MILYSTIPSQAIDAEADQVVGIASFAGVISGVSLVPEAAVTGDDTNTRSFNLINKGQSGVGTTSVATLALETGTDLVAFDEMALTLSGTEANLVVAKGDVLVLAETVAGDGLVHSGGRVLISITPVSA